MNTADRQPKPTPTRDDYGQIAPESARAATLTPEQPVKAPGQGEDSQRPSERPSEPPVLPRRIEPADVRVGMLVERRKGDAAHRDRVQRVDGERIVGTTGSWLWIPGHADIGWTLWLIEDAPAPVDPDAEALDQMAQAMANLDGSDDATEWVPWAEVALDALRETHDVTPRVEFIDKFFIAAQGVMPDDEVTRIEWRYLDTEAGGPR